MSIGYCGICKKVYEDNEIVIYTYAGENWNDGGKSKNGDALLQDGRISIIKRSLDQKNEKRGEVLATALLDEDIVIENECKNAFRKLIPVDYIAWMLLKKIVGSCDKNGVFPNEERFIQ